MNTFKYKADGINHWWERRTCFPSLGADENPITHKCGIRSHYYITALFLNLLGKITYVQTKKGTICLNKNSFNKWIARHRNSVDPLTMQPETILNNVIEFNFSLNNDKKNKERELIGINCLKSVEKAKKTFPYEKCFSFQAFLKKNKDELTSELETLNGLKIVDKRKKDVAYEEIMSNFVKKTEEFASAMASKAKKIGKTVIKATVPVDLSYAEKSFSCAKASLELAKKGQIKGALCSGVQAVGWLTNSCFNLFVPKEVRNLGKLQKLSS